MACNGCGDAKKIDYNEASGTVYRKKKRIAKNDNQTCEQKLKRLENNVRQRGYDLWVYADNVTVIPGKKGLKDKVIFSNIRSCAKYQVYNEYNKKLNKDRIITKMSPSELNKILNKDLGPNWKPTCYMEYERSGDNKLRSFAFDLHKSRFCKGRLIFSVNLSHLDGNPEYLSRLKKAEKGSYAACNIDLSSSNVCSFNCIPCAVHSKSTTCPQKKTSGDKQPCVWSDASGGFCQST
jgi:hypothetical protein